MFCKKQNPVRLCIKKEVVIRQVSLKEMKRNLNIHSQLPKIMKQILKDMGIQMKKSKNFKIVPILQAIL